MRVLHLISGLRGGGAEHFVLELCRQSLKDPEVDMQVLTLGATDDISYKFRDAGIKVISASSAESRKKFRSINAIRGLLLVMKQPRSVLHAHMFHACIIACWVKILRPSTKIIFTLHNNHVTRLHRRLLLFATRFLRKTDIIFPSAKLKWYQKKNPVTIPNGVDTSRFNHQHIVKSPVFSLVFAGRLEVEKNPMFLPRLVKLLAPEFDFVIRVAGDGPLKHELINAIENEKLEHYFVMHGHVDDIPGLFAESHCLLIPSLWEGMPLVLLEAAAAGIPVIATPTGNIFSIINGSNGYIAELDEFHKRVAEVMNNYGEALIRARRLKHTVNNEYNIMSSYSEHKKVYLQ
jgi:glycosyltransferase involved in cell wall biosynthesis